MTSEGGVELGEGRADGRAVEGRRELGPGRWEAEGREQFGFVQRVRDGSRSTQDSRRERERPLDHRTRTVKSLHVASWLPSRRRETQRSGSVDYFTTCFSSIFTSTGRAPRRSRIASSCGLVPGRPGRAAPGRSTRTTEGTVLPLRSRGWCTRGSVRRQLETSVISKCTLKSFSSHDDTTCDPSRLGTFTRMKVRLKWY